ncbi:MAG: HTH domain-containing protein [Candidatus Sabulitectum sp.]|nr:HTH domain-containing protein [Candidatus Sabulitectum sp.]
MPSSAAVVRILRNSNGFVSGEEIAESLGVSRAAVWKHIRNLRNMGFDISASTNKGYMLVAVPDIPSVEVLSSLLSTYVFGKTVEYHPVITSTNDRAMELGLSGAACGTVVTAGSQTAGKARNGGSWSSPSGKNLYLSIVVRPGVAMARAGEVADMALRSLDLAACRFFPDMNLTLRDYGLFLGEKKLGGVLCEVRGEIGLIHYMAAGAGLNISHHEVRSGTESLFSLTGKMLSRAELTAAVIEEFENLYLNWRKNEQTGSI